MRLFLYGTLLDRRRLAMRSGDPSLPDRLRPATLTGYQRVSLPGGQWPTLVRAPGGRVPGAVVDASAAAVARLSAWETPLYRLVPVVVATATGKTAARTWIAPGGMRLPWKE